MKLLKPVIGHRMSGGGNVNTAAVMGDTGLDGFSDRGSIPLSSTKKGKREKSQLSLFYSPIICSRIRPAKARAFSSMSCTPRIAPGSFAVSVMANQGGRMNVLFRLRLLIS